MIDSEYERLKEKYTRVVDYEDAGWSCYLVIDHQSFCVVDRTDRARADYYAVMLVISLARMIEKEIALQGKAEMNLNPFESQLVEDLYYEFLSRKGNVTPGSCKEYAKTEEFDWEDLKSMEDIFDCLEPCPNDLVSIACFWAWSQVRWDLVAEEVKKKQAWS